MFPLQKHKFYRFDDFTVDAARRLLLRDNQPIPLNPKAFDLLVVLVESGGKLMTKEELLERVWPNQFVEEGNLPVHMSAVRKALGERKGEPRYILTMPGRGYRFVPQVGQGRETGDGLAIEQHTFSGVVVEREGEESDEIANEAIEGVATERGLRTVAPGNAAQRLRLVGSATALDQQTAGRLLARWRWPRGKVLLFAGGIPGLIMASALVYQFYSQRQKRQAGGGNQGSVQRMTSRQLTASGYVHGAALSPDGKYFAYEGGKDGMESLWFGHVNGGNPVQLRPPENAFFGGLHFARDGGSILYQRNGSLFQMPVLGGAPRKILGRVPPNYALSYDGKSVAFVRRDGDRKVSAIVIANLDGSGEREIAALPAGAGFSSYGPAWSPDGRLLAIGAASQTNPNQHVLMSVQVADGAMQQLNPQAWDEISTVAWTNDGGTIVFHGRGPQSDYHIWLLDYPQGDLRCITTDPSRYGRESVSLADDGNSLVAVRAAENGSIWVGPADDIKQSRQITNASFGKQDGYYGLEWTPDGKIVYVSSFNGSHSLWVMNQDGSGAKQITPSGFTDLSPRVIGDGRYIVFESNRGGSSEIWRVNPDGSDMRRLTSGGNNTNPEPTPDGKWVLYCSIIEGSGTMWKVSIDGGEPVRVIEVPADCPKVSPDGKLLACAYSDLAVSPHTQLAILSMDDFSLLYHFDLAPHATFNNGLHWSPDGSAVIYRNFPGGLWRQPLTGGAAEKLAGAPDKRIYYYDWSRDRKQFAMAYGDDIRDAVLISNFR